MVRIFLGASDFVFLADENQADGGRDQHDYRSQHQTPQEIR
jgi:hypothetical protein